MTRIRFTSGASPYQAGEVASFPEEQAARYIERGVAELESGAPEEKPSKAARSPKTSKAPKGPPRNKMVLGAPAAKALTGDEDRVNQDTPATPPEGAPAADGAE